MIYLFHQRTTMLRLEKVVYLHSSRIIDNTKSNNAILRGTFNKR